MKTREEKRAYDRLKKTEARKKDPDGYRAYMRSWCAKNREKVRETNRNAYQENREARCLAARAYRKLNADAVRERARKRHEKKKNDPKYIEQRRQYGQREEIKIKRKEYYVKYFKLDYANAKLKARQALRKALSRGADRSADTIDIYRMKKAAHVCPYCGEFFKSEKDKQLDHIQPICRGGEHKLHNVIVCCKTCNLRKAGKMPVEFAVKF